MFVLSSGNPFIGAYLQSDWFGRGIFLGLFSLSIASWCIILHKAWILFHVRKYSREFSSLFSEKELLSLQFVKPKKESFLEVPHPFFEIYKSFKTKALAVINRNHLYSPGNISFSDADLDLLASENCIAASMQMKRLEKYLFWLPTIASLGPFVGLLGTVWGILISFSQGSGKALSGGSEAMLAGISLALATTVIGLVVAIPALIGNNYLKNALREQKRDMDDFSHQLLASLELQYRQGDHAAKTTSHS